MTDPENDLLAYPRPSVAVDTAVLTLDEGVLAAALVGPDPRLPGTFVHPGETLARAALRALSAKAGIEGLDPQQLHVFDAPDRDDRGWVMAVAHLDVVPAERLRAARVRLHPVADLPPLPFDHAEIVAYAVTALRREYQAAPDPRGLVPEPFTLRALRAAHEGVAGRRLQPDTFRRAMLPHLEPTGEVERAGRGRPAELFRRGRG
ncbi:NUDIX domain-containing protein [Microbacterium sp. ZXX196]|uniref:NUDIX hydrolase n=1 Tax=Microbacterium sp. ZXX196 TaxID=2609291 RepID=UPI0034D1D450